MIEVVLQDPDTQISHKCAYRILMQWSKRSCHRDLVQGPDTSGPKDPDTEILKFFFLHKLSHRTLIQWSKRIPIQWSRRILIQRSCRSGPRGSWHKRSKRSRNRDLAQVVLQDPDTSGPKGSYTYTGAWKESRSLIQRSCTSDPTGPWCKRFEIRKDLDTDLDPDAEIWRKWSYRILVQVVRGPTGSWYKWSTRVLIQRSCYKCRADLPSLLVGVHSHTLFGVSCRDCFFCFIFFFGHFFFLRYWGWPHPWLFEPDST